VLGDKLECNFGVEVSWNGPRYLLGALGYGLLFPTATIPSWGEVFPTSSRSYDIIYMMTIRHPKRFLANLGKGARAFCASELHATDTERHQYRQMKQAPYLLGKCIYEFFSYGDLASSATHTPGVVFPFLSHLSPYNSSITNLSGVLNAVSNSCHSSPGLEKGCAYPLRAVLYPLQTTHGSNNASTLCPLSGFTLICPTRTLAELQFLRPPGYLQ
jgi:hypothetical protein